MSKSSTKTVYGNFLVEHPDGFPMFRCNNKKAKWYLSRKLAEIIEHKADGTIVMRLTFRPDGNGHHGDDFYLQSRQNCCVVCGATDNLTRHHCVPYMYRKNFPEQMKIHSSHDILVVCVDHHEEYERKADEFKRSIAKKVGLPYPSVHKTFDREKGRIASLANAILKYREQIPVDKQIKMLAELREKTGKTLFNEMEIENLANSYSGPVADPNNINHGKEVIDRIVGRNGFESLFEFASEWRKHFLDTMNPQFMPDNWDVNHRRLANTRKSEY